MMDESPDAAGHVARRVANRDICDHCNSTQDVQKFHGSELCRDCRQEYAAMMGGD